MTNGKEYKGELGNCGFNWFQQENETKMCPFMRARVKKSEDLTKFYVIRFEKGLLEEWDEDDIIQYYSKFVYKDFYDEMMKDDEEQYN